MSPAARKYLIGILLVVFVGAVFGWLYERTLAGIVIALAAIVTWQVRQLLSFDRALHTNNFDAFRDGEGIWEQIFSRLRFETTRARRRKSAYRKLLQEIRKSTNAMPDGAMILDESNEIITSNRAAGVLVGVKRKKDRGQRIDNIVRDPSVAKLVNSADFAAGIEIPSPLIDGNWLHLRVVPYGVGQKLVLIRDITERRRMGKMRRDFVANASHELRSPLTVVSGYLDALAEDQRLSSDWVGPVEQMRSQASRMNNILAEMLELSRLEASGAARKDESIDMSVLLNKIRDDFVAINAKIAIVVDIRSSAALLGVQSEIESVVVNLLSNAIRHSEDGGLVTLRWSSNEQRAELSVIDKGDGIDQLDIPRLTERFFRVDRGRSRDGGGYGLGLAIVKHVLLRHEAEIDIESEVGKGSTFTCLFPADRMVFSPPTSL